jgi:quercetin dioxygenase-like cupin family protein
MTYHDWKHEKGRTVAHGYNRGVAVGNELMMAHVRLEPGTITASHRHAYEEIVYVVSGCWEITVNGETTVVGADQTLTVPPHAEHSAVALEETLAVVATNYRPEWNENSDLWLHYNAEHHLWAV